MTVPQMQLISVCAACHTRNLLDKEIYRDTDGLANRGRGEQAASKGPPGRRLGCLCWGEALRRRVMAPLTPEEWRKDREQIWELPGPFSHHSLLSRIVTPGVLCLF